MGGIKISTIWDVDLLQVRSGGWVKKIQLHSLDVVESPAEKAGRLTKDGNLYVLYKTLIIKHLHYKS